MIIHEAIESLFKNQLEIHCNPKEFIGQLTRTTITVFEPTITPGKSWGVPLWYMFLDGRRTKRSPTTWNAYDYICICFNNRQYMWSRGGTWQLVQSRIPRDSRPYLNNSICELCQKPFTLLISRQSPQTCAISDTYVWTCAEANLIGESAANMICSF